MARIGMLELDQLPPMRVLEILNSEGLINARMAKFVELWKLHDPPAGAAYDVENLEFDPVRIVQELGAFFELLLRDRVNQAAKSVTTAFASGTDLDAIASRYPGGVPRLAGETDDRYRMRIWLSANTLSPHGIYENYVFWALTADPTLRDVTAAAKRGTPNVTVTIMKDGAPITTTNDGLGIGPYPNPTPLLSTIDAVRKYIEHDARKALTDVVTVRPPKLRHIDYKVRFFLYPGWDQLNLTKALYTSMANLLEKQRWLGYSHTQAAVEAALMTSGVFNVIVDEPQDTLIEPHELVLVDSVTLSYAGRGGLEEGVEP